MAKIMYLQILCRFFISAWEIDRRSEESVRSVAWTRTANGIAIQVCFVRVQQVGPSARERSSSR